MNVVLATNDHFAFSSSTWSSWVGSPYDLQLVAKDGAVGAHRGLLLPLLQPLGVLVQASGCCGTVQLILPDSSIAAITAAKDLLYNGCCQLDMDFLPEILETLSLLGAHVLSSSFVVEAITYHMEDSPPSISAQEKPDRINRPLDAVKFAQGKLSDKSGDALMSGSVSLVKGMVFPNFEEMIAHVRKWSLANHSPVSMSSNSRKTYKLIYFRCPHKLKRKSESTGKRKPKCHMEYADCPFLVKMKGNNSDGSFTVTGADTNHMGHKFSEALFKRYCRKKAGTSAQGNLLMPKQDKSEEKRVEIMKESSSKVEEGESDEVSGLGE